MHFITCYGSFVNRPKKDSMSTFCLEDWKILLFDIKILRTARKIFWLGNESGSSCAKRRNHCWMLLRSVWRSIFVYIAMASAMNSLAYQGSFTSAIRCSMKCCESLTCVSKNFNRDFMCLESHFEK